MRYCSSIAVLLFATACIANNDASSVEFVTRDSNGITILTRAAPAWKPDKNWLVGVTTVAIGGASGQAGHDLYRVAGAARIADGTILIANGGTGELRRFASDGTFAGTIGGLGDGPSEFRALSWLGRGNGDSLLVWDRGRNRVVVYDGNAVQARAYAPGQLPETSLSLEVRGTLGGQLVLTRGSSFIPASTAWGLQRLPLSAYLISNSGELLRTFGPFPGESIFVGAGKQPGSATRTPVPFGGSTLIAAGADYLFAADNGSYDIRVYDVSGRLLSIMRRPYTTMPLLPEDVQAEIEERLSPLPPVQSIRAAARAALEAVPRSELMPPLRSLRVDRDGFLWVEAGHRWNSPHAVWSVFSLTEGWLGEIRLPATSRILEIGRNYVLVLDRDSMDVEIVRVLSLRRG